MSDFDQLINLLNEAPQPPNGVRMSLRNAKKLRKKYGGKIHRGGVKNDAAIKLLEEWLAEPVTEEGNREYAALERSLKRNRVRI